MAGCPSSHQPTRIREETLESGGPLQRKLNFRLHTKACAFYFTLLFFYILFIFSFDCIYIAVVAAIVVPLIIILFVALAVGFYFYRKRPAIPFHW